MFLPEPWDEELLSSWLTRAGKYYGRNVRNMSWACFGNIAICHPQFPKHTRQFADILGWIDTETLIAKHTFYPLVAPFAETALRERLLDWLCGNPSGLSRVSAKMLQGTHLDTYRFCKECWQEQNATQKGDMGWIRTWQIPQCKLCPKHELPLMNTTEPFRDQFGATRNIDWTDVNFDQAYSLPVRVPQDFLMTHTADRLLNRPLTNLPEKEQWDSFWERKLDGWTDDDLSETANRYWGKDYLERLGVDRVGRDFLKGVGRRIWWKNLILLRATDPKADLLQTIDLVYEDKLQSKGQTL